MISQARGQWKAMPCILYLYVGDVDAIYKKALAAGATSISEPKDQFYGDRHGGVDRPTGNTGGSPRTSKMLRLTK